MHLPALTTLITLLFLSLANALDAQVEGSPGEPLVISPNRIAAIHRDRAVGSLSRVGGMLEHRASCPAAYGSCNNIDGCCPIGGDCCSDQSCCDIGYVCKLGGCCPQGKTCSTTGSHCTRSGYLPCENDNFCCPAGDVCYRDSAGAALCRASVTTIYNTATHTTAQAGHNLAASGTQTFAHESVTAVPAPTPVSFRKGGGGVSVNVNGCAKIVHSGQGARVAGAIVLIVGVLALL
ncbi:hypothetical protein FRC08_008699 [Ceratobasidium sp. 394]|nr:hypothetical protein FRC08_008699 [Ceratobasidium sp. 394]KAG9083991.1 hypothetical protein FS749_005587 [Ceratobasidium sp. UAMH 11750]